MGDANRWAAAASSGRKRASEEALEPMSHNTRKWAELPEPLMAKVVRALTFESLVALRRVSRDWREVVVHHASACRLNPVVRHVFMVVDKTDYACYSPQQDDWYSGSLRFPGLMCPEGFGPIPRASAGGLLFFVAYDVFVVANPLTKVWKELPKIPGKGAEIRTAAMGMCYHAPSKSYSIVVAESERWEVSAFTAVFNSLAEEWDVTEGSCGMRDTTFTRRLMELVYVNGSFYGTVGRQYGNSLLVRYRVQQQRWSLDEVGLPCSSARNSFIFSANLGEMDGQLVLTAPNYETGTVSVWVFSQAEHKWNVVKAEGMSLVQHVSLLRTVFVGDFLYWKIWKKRDHPSLQDHPSLLVHHLKRHSWNSAKELPDNFGCGDDTGCFGYCTFEPSLHASP